jgi:hypothetical protein
VEEVRLATLDKESAADHIAASGLLDRSSCPRVFRIELNGRDAKYGDLSLHVIYRSSTITRLAALLSLVGKYLTGPVGLLERSVMEIAVRQGIQEAGKRQAILDEHAGALHIG